MSTKQGFILGSSHARKELSVLDTRADIWGGSIQSPLTWLLNGATHAGSERSKPSVWLMFTTRRLTVRSPLPSELRTLQSRSRKLTDDDKVLGVSSVLEATAGFRFPGMLDALGPPR